MILETNYLTDLRDQIVFGETPTLMQPLHGEALPKPETGKHRFVIAREGVYIEAINPVLEVRLPVARSAITLPYGQIGATGVRLVHGRIPKRIFEDAYIKAFLAAPNEWAGLVVWDRVREEYGLHEPDVISISAGHVSYLNVLPDELDWVLDLHSHGNMPAFFSETDDKSDIGGFYIAGVIGDSASEAPSFATRLVVNGHFFECSCFRTFFSHAVIPF